MLKPFMIGIETSLGGRFGYFLCFLLEAGEGGVRGAGKEGFFLRKSQGGSVSRAGRGEGPGGC